MTKRLFSLLVSSMLVMVSGCTANIPASEESATLEAKIKIGGSAETYEVLELLSEAYASKENSAAFEFFPPSQTSGGIYGVENNTIDIGGMSRAIAEDEKDKLNYISLVEIPLVIAVHNSVTGITDISAEQIRSIYAGDITNWQELGGPEAKIALLDFTEDENEKQVLRQAYLGFELEVTPDAIVFAEDDELIETAAITEFSIAAVPLEDELEDLPLNIVNIDGVEPSYQSLQSKDYPMSLSLGMVLAESPAPNVDAFAKFITSAEGQQLLATFVD